MKPSLLRASLLSLPLATAIASLLAVQASDAASQTWGANANSAWYTATNWAAGGVPGLQGAAASNTDVATFTSAATSTSFGINMNAATAYLNLGAISVDSTRTAATTIGNSSTTVISGNGQVLRLYGATVNSVANTVLSNAGSGLLTISNVQGSGNQFMGVVLSNTTDNIVNASGTGGITISSSISESVSGNKLTKTGAGTLTLSGTNTFSGGLTIKGGIVTSTATNDSAFGTGTIFFNTGGAVNATVQSGNSGSGRTFANPITVVAGSTGTNTLGNTTNTTIFSGLITANDNLTINSGAASLGLTVFGGGGSVASGKTISLQNSTTGILNANGIVTGSGGVSTGGAGAGTINITGASTYTGGFTLGGSSTVVLATSSTGTDGSPTDGPLGAGSTAAILGTGTIRAGTGADVTIRNTLTLAGNVSTGPTIASEKSLIFTGPATLTGTRTFTTALGGTVPGTSLTFSGNIGESGGAQGITKAGAGTMILSGTNSYTGTTTVSAGVLRLDSAGALGSGNLSLTGGVLGLGSGNLSLTAGTGVGQYQLNGGGFAAYGGNRTVSIGGSTVNWATTGLTGTLLLGAADSDSTITLSTPISQAGAVRTIQVADGSAAIDAVLSGGTTNNTGGWTKTGTGTLALTASNLYTGATSVSAGTLMLGNGTGNTGNLSTTASISVSSGATLAVNRTGAFTQATDLNAKVISGAGGFSQVGSGTTTLSAANTYTGTTTLSAGTLVLSVAESVNVSGPLGKQLANAAGTIVMGGGTLQYSSVNTNDYSGRFSTAASQAYNVNTNGQTVSWGTALVSSGGTLTKSGAGTLNLTNDSTFSGATTISAGTLNLGNGSASGSLASSVLNLGGGSTFNYNRTGSTTQSFTTTNLTSGVLTITAGSGNVLNLGTVVRNAGTIDFSSVGAGTVAASAASNVNGIIPGATFGNTWAVANGAGVAISGLADGSYSLTSTLGTSAASYAGANISVDNSAGTLDGTITPSSVRFNTAASNSLTLAAGSNVINSGILVTSAVDNNHSTISGGNLTSAASSDLIISQQNTANGLTISSAIVNNTSTGLIKLGAGLVTLSNSNSYSGATNVSAGTLVLSAANTISGATSVAGSATLQLGSATSMGSSTMTLASGATLQLRNDNNTTFTAPIATATGAVTYNFDVNNAGSGSNKTLSLGNLTFATSTANTINVTGGNGYTLALGTLSSPSGSGSFWNFTVNATTAAVTIAKFSAGSFGNALVLQGGNSITLSNFEMGSNGSNTLTVSGSGTVVTLGAASQTNNRAGGSATFTLSEGTLNINNALSISNPRLSGGPVAATLNLNGGTIDNTSAAAVTQTANPVQNWNGDFAFTGTKDLNLGTGAVSLGTAAGTTRTITANGGNLTIGGIISNGTTATGLTKAGAGTLVLSNANAYTGATTISGGTLQLDGSTHASSTVGIGTAGTLSGTGTVNGNATLTGGGIINKSSGTIAGTLGVTGGNWNGAGAVTGAVTSSSGTFTIGTGANLTADGGLNVTGGSIAATDSTGTITGNVNYTSSSNSSFAGVIAGSGKTLTLNNASATLALTGTNTYTGATTVTAGTLQVDGSIHASSAVSVASSATLSGSGTVNGTTAVTGGTINGSGLTLTGVTTFNGSGNTLSGTVTSTGGVSLASGAALANNGALTGAISIGNGTLTGSGGSVSGAATLSGGTINLTSGTLGGTLGVTGGNWSGAGSVTGIVTSSSNTFTVGSGANLTATSGVSVTGGTMTINGTLNGTLNANVSTTINGTGTVAGNATIEGTHNPGNSPGIQTFGGDLTYSGGFSQVNWELNDNTTVNLANPDAVFDGIVVSGNLNFADLTTLNLVFTSAGSNVLWGNSLWDTNQSWVLYDVSGSTSGFSNLNLNISDWQDSGSNLFNTVRPDGNFTLSLSGSNVMLNYNLVPEPDVAALLGGIGVLAMLRRRRP